MTELQEGEMENVARLLVDLDVPKNSAKVLSYVLLKGVEAKTMEIEGKTGLRQPEVSIAVKHLRSLGWLSKKEIKKDAKGRPVHVYTVAMKPEELVEILDKQQKKKIEQIQQSIKKLKEDLSGH